MTKKTASPAAVKKEIDRRIRNTRGHQPSEDVVEAYHILADKYGIGIDELLTAYAAAYKAAFSEGVSDRFESTYEDGFNNGRAEGKREGRRRLRKGRTIPKSELKLRLQSDMGHDVGNDAVNAIYILMSRYGVQYRSIVPVYAAIYVDGKDEGIRDTLAFNAIETRPRKRLL